MLIGNNMNKKENNFTIYIFVVSSIVVFISFLLIGFMYLADIRYAGVETGEQFKAQKKDDPAGGTVLYLKDEFDERDPYTTKVPRLKDIISGPIISKFDPYKGDVNSPITVVLFSDFECSYCSKQEEKISELVEKYNLRLVWKDYPRSDPKSSSYQAAVAARCAQLENAFWDYHDRLYASDSSINDEFLHEVARDLHFDMDEFDACLSEMKTEQLVYDNMLEAEALGIEGVPFLYVNDQSVLGEISKDELETMLELEIDKIEKN